MTSHPAWMFDELRDFGFSDPAEAAAYERDLEHDPAEDEALLDELGVSAAHTLVDIGCGAGHLAIAAARRCRRRSASMYRRQCSRLRANMPNAPAW